MTLIKIIPEDQAEGLVRDQYVTALGNTGYVPNFLKAFSLRPELYDVWTKLSAAVRSNMRLRRYELATLAAAMALECTYCVLAHGVVLRKNFFRPDELVAIVKDFRHAGLPPEEVAIMSFAQKIATQAQLINVQDIEELRGYGLSEEEILDIILATAARSFFSKVLEATGARPDDAYLEQLEPEILQIIGVGHIFP